MALPLIVRDLYHAAAPRSSALAICLGLVNRAKIFARRLFARGSTRSRDEIWCHPFFEDFIDGASTRQFQNNAVFLIPIEERYTDETDAFVWKRGLLTLSTNGTTDIVRTADELNTRFFPRSADDPETEEDESQNIPAPLTTGSLTTEVTGTNQKGQRRS